METGLVFFWFTTFSSSYSLIDDSSSFETSVKVSSIPRSNCEDSILLSSCLDIFWLQCRISSFHFSSSLCSQPSKRLRIDMFLLELISILLFCVVFLTSPVMRCTFMRSFLLSSLSFLMLTLLDGYCSPFFIACRCRWPIFMRALYSMIIGLRCLKFAYISHVAQSSSQSFHLMRQCTRPPMLFLPITPSTGYKFLILISKYQQIALILLAYNPFYQDNIVKMTYRQQPYIRPNDTYASIREQMDRETQGIIPDRNSIQVYRPSNTYVPTNRNIDTTPQSKWQPQFSQKRSGYQVEHSKKNEIKNRIKQIIDLCKDENSAVHREMTGVIEAEKGVLNLLGQAEVQGFRQVAPGGTQFTPVKTDDYNRTNTQQREIRSIITQNGHVQLPEEAHQLINEIERRSLAEIEKLKAELNYERKKNAELEKEVNYYRNSQGAPGSGYENELRSKVAYLEDLLQQQEQHKGTGGIDFNALYAQGQAIRQETLRLLRLKQAKLNGGYDDEQKRRLRQEVDRLTRKIEQLQHQRGGRASKPSYEVIAEQYSPIAPAYKRSNSNRNSANQYESLVMQMRKITAN